MVHSSKTPWLEVYQPTLSYPKWTVDGHEQQLQINYLSQCLDVESPENSACLSCFTALRILSNLEGSSNT